jgi:hypothetical protein
VGLEKVGYRITQDKNADLLLIWNRYGQNHLIAESFERQGRTVIVAENGYLGKGGVSPKFEVHPSGPKPESYYSLSIGWHNGRGVWPTGRGRFSKLGVELKPWRTAGDHILVCPNRSFGVGKQVMPTDWASRTAQRLQDETRRPVRVRGHPGNDAPRKPLEADLDGAWAVIIWSSSAGVHALQHGIPVFVEAPWWVMKGVSATGPLDNPVMPDREPHFERMAWHQWTLEEIESGEPFSHLLSTAKEGKEQGSS